MESAYAIASFCLHNQTRTSIVKFSSQIDEVTAVMGDTARVPLAESKMVRVVLIGGIIPSMSDERARGQTP